MSGGCIAFFFTGALTLLFVEAAAVSLYLLVRYLIKSGQLGDGSASEDGERLGDGSASEDRERLVAHDDNVDEAAIEVNATSTLPFEQLKDSFVIDEADFQSVWQQTAEQRLIELPRTSLLDENEVEDCFARVRVYCKAAGLHNQQQKFYFYAQHAPTGGLLLLELLIDLTKYDRPLVATIKSNDPQLLDGFQALVRSSLDALFHL